MENFINPKGPTLATTYDATISSSTELTLNSGTTYIEVTAVDKGIFLAWDRTVSSSDFDEYIGAGMTKIYIVPADTTTANFIQQSATAILVVIEK
jgi:hypothetical protein